MDKMKMESVNMTEQNINNIANLFPNCITEAKSEDGRIKKAVNFDLLRQMLSDEVLEGNEAYEFTWVGKKAAIVEANRPIRKTLRPSSEESVDWNTTENLYIEGDNLEVLKLLQESYLGKIKVIYIDPPYNTGNDFIYLDDFAISADDYNSQVGMFDDQGERLFKNTDSNGRFHSDWCSMMYSRLVLSRNLLSSDGAIFISIDDHEYSNLKNICDEIFGQSCFVADIAWQRTYSPRNDSHGISDEKEHLLVYGMRPGWTPNKLPRTEKMNSKYKNPDNDDYPWRTSDAFAPGAATHQGMVYAIQNPFTGQLIYPYKGACWPLRQSDMLNIMQGWGKYELKDLKDEEKRADVCGISPAEVRSGVQGIVLSDSVDISRVRAKEVLDAGKWPRFFFTKNGVGGIARKTYLKDTDGRVVTNFWPYSEVGHTDEAKKELKALFDGEAPFDTPKPVRLLERILHVASDKDSIILDFFSGSATMAHAVMKKNAEDGFKRKYILVQLPEQCSSPTYETLCDVGKERIRRAGQKLKTESPLTTQDLDIGFRVLKLDDSNMNDVYYGVNEYDQSMMSLLESNIKDDRNNLDLLFGCLLDWGLPLSLSYSSETIDGYTVHNYNDGDLIACFDENVSESVIKEIAKQQPLRAVFRDSSFIDSPSKINVGEIFKMLAPDTTVKVI